MPDNGLSKLINKIANSSAEDLQKYNNTDFGSNITESDAGQHARIDYSNASDFGKSQYDKATPIDQLTNNNYQYLRGERQSNWDKAGNGLVNMLGKAGTTAAEGIVNPFYGTIAALTHTDAKGKWDPSMNSYYNNDFTKQLDKVNEAVESTLPFYSDKEEATDQGLAKLWHANTIFKDIMGGAGTSIGAVFTGAAWSKAFSLLGKGLAVSADAAEAAALIEEAKTTGIALAGDKLKFVANEAMKKSIKDGARQGTIALMSATGEAGAEARETQKNIFNKLTTNPDGSPKQMTEGELEYAKMMSEQAGDAAFGMNLPVIMADNWLTFGKVMFGNKTNDFAKIANKTTLFDEATQTWKAVEKSKYANLGYRAGKIGTPMLSEGNQEMLQHAIGKTAEDYYVNKYYNPNAANFLDSFVKGMKDAYTTQEGWHAGIIGALSAGITSPGVVLATQGKSAFKDEFISNPEDKITAQAVESLNKYKVEDIRKKFVDNQIRQANLAEKKDEAIAANDDFNYHNANEDMIFSYVYNRLQNGKLNETKQEFNNFKDLTVEELKDNYGIEINVENKAQVEQLTGKGAVQKYVQERLDKLAKIEDTYNQVTKLFPNAHPDVKELLTYSAQGLENTKQRRADLTNQISNLLPKDYSLEDIAIINSDPNAVLKSLSFNPLTFGVAYNKLTPNKKELFKKQVGESKDIAPLDKEQILTKLKDIESLKEREEDFVLTYNALKDPKNASIFLAASNNLANKFINIVSQKEKMDEEETQTSNPSTNPTPVIDNTVTESPVEENPFSIEELEPTKLDSDPNFEQSLNQRRAEKQFELDEVFNNTKNLTEVPIGKTVKYKGQNYILNKHSEENVLQLQEIDSNKVIDIPLDEEFGYDAPLYYYGISEVNENPITELIDINTTGLGTQLITIDGKSYLNMFSNPLNAINYDKNGNIVSVTLNTNDKNKKPRTFKKYAEEVAYAILLETYNKLNNETQQNRARLNSRIKEETSKSDSERKEQNTSSGNNEENEQIELELKQKEDLAKQESKEISDYNDLIDIALLSEYKEELLSYVNELKSNKYYNNRDANKLNNLYKTLDSKQTTTQTPETTPTPEIKSTSDKHLVLNTPPEARDTQVLYTDKDGVEHLVGEYRSNENNQLDAFDDVRQALEYFKSAREPKTLVNFTEVNGFVMLQIANVNISTISKKGGSPEQKAISDLFYNSDGSVKSLEEINNLYQAGVIQLDLTKHLNTLLKDDVKPTLAEVLPMLYEEAYTVKLKKGNRETNVVSTEDEVSYENELSELQSDIAEGLHIEMVVDGRMDVIKVKTKTNDNAQQSFDEVIDTITNSQGDSKIIKEAIDKFNNELFFALEPIKGVVRKFQLNYSVKTNTFYFTLQTKDKNTGTYSAPVQMKNSAGINILNNIHPSILSAEYVIDQLADSNVNKSVKFSAKNIRYSSFTNEKGETDTNKLEVYIDPNGLFKYGVQFSINAEAKPLATTTVDVVKPTVTTIDPKADIERRRQEELSEASYIYDNGDVVTESDAYGTITYKLQDKKDTTNLNGSKITTFKLKVIATDLLPEFKNSKNKLQPTVGAIMSEPYVSNNFLKFGISKTPESIKITQDKINAKYDAKYVDAVKKGEMTKEQAIKALEEVGRKNSAAYAELAALENKIEKPNYEITSFEDLLRQQEADTNEESNPDEVYSVGLEESTGITQSEIDAVKAILPRFISFEDIATIANNLKVKGIPYGVFKNKVIYLNKTKGKPGTAYHEAFHAVFRTMLNDSQIEKYYNAASEEFKKSGKNMKQEIEKLRSTVASYTNKSEIELENLVLEEFMADKFMDYSMNKNQEQTGNLLKQLFFKIKNFFKELFNIGEELDMFYDNILKGKFANSQEVGNTYFNITDSVFKLLPKKNNAQENGFFNASESRKIIGYFAIKIHKAKLSGQFKELTDEELLDKFIAERIEDLDTKGLAYGNSIFASNPEYAKELANKTASEKYLYDKNSINNAKIRPYDVLKSSVNDKLAIFKYKTAEEANEEAEGGEEATHMKDTFGSQDSFLSGGHDSLSQTIKKYVAFTTRIERDEITNEDREVGIDEVALYNGLTSILADTSEERMIAKLYDASESNSNIKAFYDQLITDLGITFDPETRTTSYPINPEASNITRALLTNFKNSKATQIDVLVGESWVKDAEGKNTKVKANTWVNANKNDAKKISLERWKTKVTYISRQKSIKEFQKNFNKVPKIVNNYYKGNLSLDAATKQIKELLDTNGITLTSIYIKISLAKQKALVKPDDVIAKDKNFISIYDTTEPIDFNEIFGSISGDDKFSIGEVIKEDLKALFDEKDGVLGRLGKLAENNAKFDETIANFSFTNAEGKKVYEIIKPSYVLSRPELYKKDSYWESVEKGEGLTEVEKKNTHFLKDNYLVTKHKDLLKNLKINILSGFRDTTIGTSGKSKDGVTFGSFDARTYLLSAITLYHNKGNKEVGKYMFRQNEASSTGYVAELPKIDINSVAGQQQMTDYFLTQVTKEWNRIKREKKAFDKKPGDLKGYNTTEKGRAFDFTEFQYLKDTMGTEAYKALVDSALDTNVKELTSEQISAINKGVRSYLTASFEEFKKTVDKNQIRLFLTDEMKGEQSSFDSLLWEFYVNDYIMSNSLNELMDGDYALSRKDKVDISKRNKGAMASGPDFGRGQHTSAIIKDIDLYTSTVLINNKLIRVKPEFDTAGNLTSVTDESGKVLELTKDQIASYTSNDAMSYASQFHMMMGAFRLGRVNEATRQSYKDIIQFTKKDKDGNVIRNVNIGDKSQKALSEALASLNSKKTIVFDGINGQYLKMSELGFIRSAISYIDDKDVDKFTELTDKVFDLMTKDDYESNEFRNTIKELTKLYKPVAGMDYWHKLANNMDLHGIDHLAVESASKGATRSPQDSQATDLDLSKSKFNVSNSNKRLQVETPTGKKEIVTGSQILTLIASELKDNEKVNGVTLGQLRKEYNEAIASTRNSSFKRAMSVIKKLSDGTIDKSELDEVVKRALAASGADEQLLEFFDSPLNYNMIQMIVKAEQVILSHFSKGVLSQKVNGDKVSLVTDAGINVVREISTGRVISHHEIVKNPSVYSDTTKYTQSKLKYNVEEGDLKYSECMLSQTVLTRHGLKIGDVITPEMTEVLKMLGYRIPTGDKQSAMSLKVVSLLPDYYNGIGIFPSEIVHLSGADFDIDSEFIQMPYFWYKKDAPTVPIKYGSEKSVKDAFEGFKFYNLNYDKDFSRDYKELLANNYKYRSLKKAVKQVQAEIDEVKGRTKQDLILGSQGLKGEMEIIENNIYMQVSTKYGLPFTEKDFIAKGKKPNAVLNNEALDRMISMLANNHTAEIANNTTSTDALKSLVSKMKSEGFIKESESKVNQKNKSASDINGKFDANSKNSAGKNGIGIAANKIQQFALLMSKVGDKVVKFNDEAFKFEIANEAGGKYSAINKDNQRIADNLNILLNVFTDNAKDPIAGELNIQFELLGGFTELIMQGMSFENAVKFINLPIIQEYGKVQKALKSKVKTEIEESFNKNNAQAATIVSLENGGKINTKAIELVNKTAEKINPEQKEITLKQIENILLGKEFTKEELGDANDGDTMSVQYQALAQFIKVQEQYNVMATLNTFLTLNQGLDTSFTELNFKLHKAIDTWGLNDFLNELDDNLNIEDHGLSVGEAHIDIKPILKDDSNTLGNIQRALEVSKEVGQKIFIEQTELFNKEFNKLLDNLQDKFSNVADNVSDVSREFLGYVSVKAYLDELESLKNEVGTKEVNKQAIQKRLDSLNLGLIFNDLAGSNGNLVSQLELLKSNPATKDNYIIKYFTVKENIIDTKSFVKESNETISLLIDSVKSLYFDNKTQLNGSGLTPRDFVDNMLSYLMVKDNMQFKNNSVAKYLPVNMFSKYSNTLDDLVKGLVTKNTSMNFAEVGYNFRKMYVTDVNTSYGAMQTIKLDPKDNTPVRLNGENLEFAIDTTTEDGLKESSATLSKIFSKLDVKTKIKTWPAFKFPQFIKVRLSGNEYQIFELDSFTNNAKNFINKKDNFLNYIDASQGVKHNLENAYAGGEKATYKPLTQIGVKDVSVFFPGTYDKAKVLFDQVKPEEVNKIPTITKPGKFTPIEEIGKPVNTNPYAMTSELANDVSTEVNASEITLPEEKALKVEEKDVTLDAKKNLLAMVNSQELFIEGKEFTEAQYQKLRDRINAAKTMNELMALEENITKCM